MGARAGAAPGGDAPLVSVVLPCCNHERQVARSIDSVLAQTYSHLELIVIHDDAQDGMAACASEHLASARIPVRVIALAEPMAVMGPLYFYEAHARHALGESRRGTAEEAGRMVLPLLERLDAGGCTNPLAPQWPANRVLLQRSLLDSGLSDCVSGKRHARDCRRGAEGTALVECFVDPKWRLARITSSRPTRTTGASG